MKINRFFLTLASFHDCRACIFGMSKPTLTQIPYEEYRIGFRSKKTSIVVMKSAHPQISSIYAEKMLFLDGNLQTLHSEINFNWTFNFVKTVLETLIDVDNIIRIKYSGKINFDLIEEVPIDVQFLKSDIKMDNINPKILIASDPKNVIVPILNFEDIKKIEKIL